jgi:hypothetical protein
MDINAKNTILPVTSVSSTGGESAKYQSNLVGGAKKNKKSKKTAKKATAKRTKRTRTTRKSCGWFW